MSFTMIIHLKRYFILLILCSITIFTLFVAIHSHKKGVWWSGSSNVKKSLDTKPKSMSNIQSQNESPLDFWSAVNDTVTVAKNIMKKKHPVLVTLVNNAYLPFVYSWLCNTIYMNIHEQVLFITTDEQSKVKLKNDWPNVNVVSLPEEIALNDNQAYSKVGYVKLMVKRTEVLNSLLINDIEMLLFEVDCLWISNPIEDCRRRAKTNDVIVTCIDRKPSSIAGGFIYMKPTAATKKLWDKLTQKMRALGREIQKKKDPQKPVSDAKNDQIFFMQLIHGRYGKIKYNVLPWDYYPDGKWYSMKKSKREQKRPVIINNNWVIGNAKKMSRAKKWGHWFVDDNLKCLMNDVDKVVNKGLYDQVS